MRKAQWSQDSSLIISNATTMPIWCVSQVTNAEGRVITKKEKIMKKSSFFEIEGIECDAKYILRQIGFGAVLGAAFLGLIYFGGLLAHLVSGL